MKKLFSSFLILAVISTVSFAPAASRAQTTGAASGVAQPSSTSEAGTSAAGDKATNDSSKGIATSLGDAASCSVSLLLSNVILKSITGLISRFATDKTQQTTSVPDKNIVLQGNSNADTAAHTGSLAPGGIFTGAAWDAIAFCIGNALIQYLTQSINNWINTGFNGNPAFVANPTQFLSDIANQTAGNFINTIGGAAGQAIGQGVQGFQQGVTKILVGTVNSSLIGENAMTMNQYMSNGDVQGFYQGVPQNSIGGFQGVAMGQGNSLPSVLNNVLPAFGQAVASGIGNAQQSSGINNGTYQNVQNCQTNPDGSKGPCVTTVQGSDIQRAGQDARNMANLRVVAAQKFDQVIANLVNALIKVALNKLLTTTSKSTTK